MSSRLVARVVETNASRLVAVRAGVDVAVARSSRRESEDVLNLRADPLAVERVVAECVGRSAAQTVEQLDRGQERPSAGVEREARPAPFECVLDIRIHPRSHMGTEMPGVEVRSVPYAVIPLDHLEQLVLQIPVADLR